jgi:hypothetical protein
MTATLTHELANQIQTLINNGNNCSWRYWLTSNWR